MNTKQLIAFWYTGLILVAVLIGFASEHPNYTLWVYLSVILTLGGMFIYSLGSHPDSNKKTVAYSVLIPLVLLISTSLIIAYHYDVSKNKTISTSNDKKPELLTKEDIEIFDAKLSSNNNLGWTNISGRVRNNSDVSLWKLELRVNIYEKGELYEKYETRELVDGSDVKILFTEDIPPKAVQSFREKVFNINFPDDWTWTYTIKDVEASL